MKSSIDNQKHRDRRALIRVLGIAFVVVGLLFMAVGLISFFSAFGGGGTPKYFWCCFVGMPFLAIGMALCKFAFLGAMIRFMASETAPVGVDTVNYMAAGTKDAVRDVAEAIGEGLSTSLGDQTSELRCHECNAENDVDASFCNQCGASFKDSSCPSCHQQNDADAKFCDNCGTQL